MKNSVKLFFAALGTILMASVSCTKDSIETPEAELAKQTCKMKLVGSLVNYDSTDTKAEGTESSWDDGSVIYLRMNSSIGITQGEAIYDLESNLWTVNYYGALDENVTSRCTAVYATNASRDNHSLLTLNVNSATYEDLEGSYIFTNGELVVTATLKPKTGRVRFSGKVNSEIKVYGVTHYTLYNLDTDTYSTSTEPVKMKVGEDGYTPYIYGYFTDTDEPTFKVWVDAAEAYTKYCSSTIFQTGQSGKFTIPTADSHNGWAEGLHFNVNGARFKMVAVEGGTFKMGEEGSTDTYMTAHNVTLTGYCIAETEMTNLLWSRVADKTANPSYPNKPYPYSSMATSFSNIKTRLSYLNNLTSAGFDLPTEAQWEFAAKGGTKSKGYTYSGSNDIDEVAWYSGNASGTVHEVKQKKPNELGLYDMNGNVQEWTKDYYTYYPTTDQKDPYVGPEGLVLIVVRGGSISHNSSYNTCIARNNILNTSYLDYGGIRLILNWN